MKLDEDTRRRLQALGEKRDRSPHWLMKRAVMEFLEREEALEQEQQEDLARWERFCLTGEALPQASVAEWLDGFGQAATPFSRR
ncbi:CopG family ribbon-helix-helix protein [Teichococcus vastitatis]|uniref:Ribbon-helix-helix protein, CopG family n=1 Tax=Teichococcus vastitatis TaxID=2307076 RepID=A0ABS9WBL4_9PROT|nr:ribbon-helix-helix protein, CopG family [Pseudoroseomonas vastitatis]MCI0755994.1 ribbon-helix-helix protein, CopG family [Pseudoroseomonas vastitatis]